MYTIYYTPNTHPSEFTPKPFDSSVSTPSSSKSCRARQYHIYVYMNLNAPHPTTTYRSILSRILAKKNKLIGEGSARYRQNGLIAGSSPSHTARHGFVMLSQCPRFRTTTIDLLQPCHAESLTVTKVDVLQV